MSKRGARGAALSCEWGIKARRLRLSDRGQERLRQTETISGGFRNCLAWKVRI